MARLRRKALVALSLLLAMCSCASDTKLVRNALASRHYHAEQFKAACPAPYNLACFKYGSDIDLLLEKVKAANEAKKRGRLPASARHDLKVLPATLEADAAQVQK